MLRPLSKPTSQIFQKAQQADPEKFSETDQPYYLSEITKTRSHTQDISEEMPQISKIRTNS